MPRQLRFRFPKVASDAGDELVWVIARCGSGATPFAVVKLVNQCADLRAGVAYAVTLEAARQHVPGGLLCIEGTEAARARVRGLPVQLADVIEFWF
jgi:hypothetical protein